MARRYCLTFLFTITFYELLFARTASSSALSTMSTFRHKLLVLRRKPLFGDHDGRDFFIILLYSVLIINITITLVKYLYNENGQTILSDLFVHNELIMKLLICKNSFLLRIEHNVHI